VPATLVVTLHAALPEIFHPLALNDFFTKPIETSRWKMLSVREGHLRGGGSQPVLWRAESDLLGG
jgi:hypothetical protein